MKNTNIETANLGTVIINGIEYAEQGDAYVGDINGEPAVLHNFESECGETARIKYTSATEQLSHYPKRDLDGLDYSQVEMA